MNRYDLTTAAGLAAYTQALIEQSSLGEQGPRRLRRRASRNEIDRIRELLGNPLEDTETKSPAGERHVPEPIEPTPRPDGFVLQSSTDSIDRPSSSWVLESLVVQVATELMTVDSATMAPAAERVLAHLVEHLGVDFGYLRRTDRDRRATVLVAEWPRRSTPDPDPLNVVYFDQPYSPFHAVENVTEPAILHADSYSDQQVTSAVVPLLMQGESIGLLGFVKHGDWAWSDQQLSMLTVIASLLAQLQARIDAETTMQYVAMHDELTGLPNHHALWRHIEQRLQPGRPGPVATLCVGMDRLKTVNNHLGRTAGDNVLRVVAARLKESLERGDMIARFGGDEFVIVPAKPMDACTAEFVASGIRQALTNRILVNGQSISCGVSVGVGVGIPGEVAADVLRRADQALRAAKTQDGNGVAVFTDNIYMQFELRDHVALTLASAVSDDSLVLHYQPEVDLRTGRVLAVEALVRWQHPTRGLLAPDTFVGVAEATNLAGDLGDWVIRAACAQFADWRRRRLASDVVLRINVSPMQLIRPNFVERVETALLEYGIPGSSVCLEITENMSVQDMPRTQMTLEALTRLKVNIAIDDFGTGYNTLSCLKTLPVNTVKIDRSFVKVLNYSTDNRAIVASIVGLAREFELEVVGEGVETPAAARALLDLGCHRAQGFLIAHPLPAEEVEAHLAAGAIPLVLERSWAPRS
ncbi:putative bifunctional diguanylate cyclase/phosphodiesterase [Nocardia lijiangensis]|uniref:putative bifunctional diguanylate cyclase/phosphodiesterase n=1 Tax=Nocardia lijiangensis TaxID=299618 RepID=UPI003D76468C